MIILNSDTGLDKKCVCFCAVLVKWLNGLKIKTGFPICFELKGKFGAFEPIRRFVNIRSISQNQINAKYNEDRKGYKKFSLRKKILSLNLMQRNKKIIFIVLLLS